MNDKNLEPSGTPWQQRIDKLRAMLKDLRPQLVAAEQQLSEQLAAISSFEFVVRSRLEPLNRRLEKLEDEIVTLQKKLRDLRDGYLFIDKSAPGGLYETWRAAEEAGSAFGGDFRYHEAPARPPRQALSSAASAELKSLYRQLARRFHPDFARDEADREYRTGVMMAINAAYTAGDLERLQELVNQPDPQRPDYTEEELANALFREVDHCQQRIREIEKELIRLQQHPSYILKQRVDEAAAAGRDLLDELAVELRSKIADRMVQRDVLREEIEAFENGDPDFADEAFTDAVFNLGLEQVLTEDDESGLSEWRDRNRDRLNLDNIADEEEGWEALRKARDKK